MACGSMEWDGMDSEYWFDKEFDHINDNDLLLKITTDLNSDSEGENESWGVREI